MKEGGAQAPWASALIYVVLSLTFVCCNISRSLWIPPRHRSHIWVDSHGAADGVTPERIHSVVNMADNGLPCFEPTQRSQLALRLSYRQDPAVCKKKFSKGCIGP